MNPLNRQSVGGQSGFSLVELAVAMFAMSIGIVAVFTLFPSAMRSVSIAQEDTVSHMFSEMVFSSLRSEALGMERAAWDDFENQAFPIPELGWMTVSSDQGNLNLSATGDEIEVTFISQPAGVSAGVINHMVRYKLTVTEGATDRSRIFVLDVIGTSVGGQSTRFATEVFRFRMTP